jgi:phospholipase/carboxylesterase
MFARMGPVLDGIEISSAKDPRWSVIWLHGLGADGHDFEPIVPELLAPGWPAVRFVFPHAPVRPVTINGGMRMRAWYDILGLEIANRQDEPGIRDSIVKVEKLIERETARGVESRRVVLAGFSQGGAIALACGLRHRQPLAAIVALSTYLPLADRTDLELAEANRGVPIWQAHGSADPVVPQALGQMSREWLRAHGYRIEWRSYPMPHSVCAEEVADLRGWLGGLFRDAAA